MALDKQTAAKREFKVVANVGKRMRGLLVLRVKLA